MSRSVSRRTLLGGAGASLLLPLLPSLWPRSARAASAVPRRLIVFFVPNGLPDALWRPATTGPGFIAPPITAALDPIRDRVTILSGLRHTNDPGGNGHHSSAGACLTARYGSGVGAPAGASFDALIADAAHGATLRASIHASGEHDTPCASTSCASSENISWRSDGQANTLETSVRAVFGKLVTTGGGPVGGRARASVLDAVRADLGRYSRAASADDAARLDAYAEGIRRVERRAGMRPAVECPTDLATPREDGFQYASDADIRAMLDTIVLGLQCDATRVATYMIGKAGSDRPLHALGVPMGHHELSHAPPSDHHTALGAWALGHFVHLVDALGAVTESDGSSLLDHTDVLFLSDMGDGSTHGMSDVPCVLAGAGAQRRAGEHLAYDGRPMADLYLALLAAHGVPQPTFGAEGTSALLDLG